MSGGDVVSAMRVVSGLRNISSGRIASGGRIVIDGRYSDGPDSGGWNSGCGDIVARDGSFSIGGFCVSSGSGAAFCRLPC